MNKEQQRIAIAEACGWQFIPEYYHGKDDPPEFTTVTPDGRHLCGYYPDYLNDLNAMHEAWQTLTSNQKITYRGELAKICAREAPERDTCWLEDIAAEFAPEAFIRTLGLWEEEA